MKDDEQLIREINNKKERDLIKSIIYYGILIIMALIALDINPQLLIVPVMLIFLVPRWWLARKGYDKEIGRQTGSSTLPEDVVTSASKDAEF